MRFALDKLNRLAYFSLFSSQSMANTKKYVMTANNNLCKNSRLVLNIKRMWLVTRKKEVHLTIKIVIDYYITTSSHHLNDF